MGNPFVHLHVHTEYSMLDGASRLADLATAAEADGQPGLAMTDHGNVFAAVAFHKTMTAKGINPIIGSELYLAPSNRQLRSPSPVRGVSTPENYTHMTVLATNDIGLRNLYRLSSQSYDDGMYYKPRVDRDLLAVRAEGLVATTGCLGGEVKTLLKQGFVHQAMQSASDYKDIFGEGNFFVEVMDHGIAEEAATMPDLMKIAKELNLPLLATNDSHYTFPHENQLHQELLCLGSGSTLSKPKFVFDGSGYYLRSAKEMWDLFPERDFPGACSNTLLVNERTKINITYDRDLFPKFPLPEGVTEEEQLWKLILEGLHSRYPNGYTQEHYERAQYEFKVILKMGYPGYFLIAHDLYAYARRVGIRSGPGRGSVPGSLIAYVLYITALDPFIHNLSFERFLNEDRVSMPDIDMDFPEAHRDKMIDYATAKYGEDYVAQIITYGSMKAKQSLKDAARISEMTIRDVSVITATVPDPIQGKDAPLKGAFDPSYSRYKDYSGMRAIYEAGGENAKVIDIALRLEGLRRSWGIHAAGVIVSGKPLAENVPLIRRELSKGERSGPVVQFDGPTCEDLGLLKLDFLGLRNLDILDDAIANVKAKYGFTIVPDELPLDDEKTYKMLARGDSLGVFQLDSAPIQDLLRQMKPTKFGDLSAVIALYRPGPMGVGAHLAYAHRKNGREPITFPHPEFTEPLQDVLSETYGIICYQEQISAIAKTVAGFSSPKADSLRYAMGKKKLSMMMSLKDDLFTGMTERGFSAEAQNKLWETMVPFADYAFNRAHAAAYGILAYWTAYLKANYPLEYFAALLTSVHDDEAKTISYIRNCNKRGIKVLPPDINKSLGGNTVEDENIRCGLGAVKGIGGAAAQALFAGREDGPFAGVADVAVRCPKLGKPALYNLVLSGAFDSINTNRKMLSEAVPEIVDAASQALRESAAGLISLFDDPEDTNPTIPEPNTTGPDWPPTTRLQYEREVLRTYLSGHPLDDYRAVIEDGDTHRWEDIQDLPDETQVTFGGYMVTCEESRTRGGARMMRGTLEGVGGSLELVAFERNGQLPQLLASREPIFVGGKLGNRGGRVSLRVDSVRRVARTDAFLEGRKTISPLVISCAPTTITPEVISQLRKVISENSGRRPIHLKFIGSDRIVELGLQVDTSNPDVERRIRHIIER